MAVIPLFPLPATIVFVGMTLPLYIFEPRYKQMIEDVLRAKDPRFVIALAREDADLRNPHSLAHDVGGIVSILRSSMNQDGTRNILVHCQERCHVYDIDMASHAYYCVPLAPYPLARDDLNRERVVAWDASNVFQAYAKHFYPKQAQAQIAQAMPQDALFLSSFICANLHLNVQDRQALLAAPSLITRLESAQEHMQAQIDAFEAFDAENDELLEDVVRKILQGGSSRP